MARTPAWGADPTDRLFAHVATDGFISLRRVANGQEIMRLDTSEVPVDVTRFSPAGHYLGVRMSAEPHPAGRGFRLYALPAG